MLDETTGRHAIGLPGNLDLGRACASGARRLRFRNLSHDVDLRRIDHPEQHRSGSDVGTGRGVALGDDAAHRARERRTIPLASVAPPARAALYCARLASAAAKRALPAPRRNEPRRVASQARHPRSSTARRAPGRASQARARSALPRAPAELRKIARRGRRREQPRELLTTRHARSKRHVHDAGQATVDRRNHVCGAAWPRLEARRHTNGLANGLFLHDGGPEVQAPLLLLEEADAWCVLAGASGRGPCRFSVRIHVDFADTSARR